MKNLLTMVFVTLVGLAVSHNAAGADVKWRSYKDVLASGFAFIPATDAWIEMDSGDIIYSVQNMSNPARWRIVRDRFVDAEQSTTYHLLDVMSEDESDLLPVKIRKKSFGGKRELVVITRLREALDEVEPNLFAQVFIIEKSAKTRVFCGDLHQDPVIEVDSEGVPVLADNGLICPDGIDQRAGHFYKGAICGRKVEVRLIGEMQCDSVPGSVDRKVRHAGRGDTN